MRNVNIMGVPQFKGRGGGGGHRKNNIKGELLKKRGLGQFGGGLVKLERRVFSRRVGGGLIPRCTL